MEKLWKTQPKISQQIKLLFKNIIPKTPLQNIIDNKKIKNLEISILLTNDQQIKSLNKDYCQKDKPTNILSFPLLNCKKVKNGNFKNLNLANDQLILGDMALSYQTIFMEAKEQNKIFDHHLAHLVIHGLLHLIGFDHEKKADAKIMEELEIRILADMNIRNPYSL
jgi:probable rRNA maturation factor